MDKTPVYHPRLTTQVQRQMRAKTMTPAQIAEKSHWWRKRHRLPKKVSNVERSFAAFLDKMEHRANKRHSYRKLDAYGLVSVRTHDVPSSKWLQPPRFQIAKSTKRLRKRYVKQGTVLTWKEARAVATDRFVRGG